MSLRKRGGLSSSPLASSRYFGQLRGRVSRSCFAPDSLGIGIFFWGQVVFWGQVACFMIYRCSPLRLLGCLRIRWLWVERKSPLRDIHLYGRCANSHSAAERMISSSEEEVGCHPKVETNNEGSATSWGGSPGRRGCISIVGVIESLAAMA